LAFAISDSEHVVVLRAPGGRRPRTQPRTRARGYKLLTATTSLSGNHRTPAGASSSSVLTNNSNARSVLPHRRYVQGVASVVGRQATAQTRRPLPVGACPLAGRSMCRLVSAAIIVASTFQHAAADPGTVSVAKPQHAGGARGM